MDPKQQIRQLYSENRPNDSRIIRLFVATYERDHYNHRPCRNMRNRTILKHSYLKLNVDEENLKIDSFKSHFRL